MAEVIIANHYSDIITGDSNWNETKKQFEEFLASTWIIIVSNKCSGEKKRCIEIFKDNYYMKFNVLLEDNNKKKIRWKLIHTDRMGGYTNMIEWWVMFRLDVTELSKVFLIFATRRKCPSRNVTEYQKYFLRFPAVF